METINIHQAKTNFSRLLSRVENEAEIIISNQGVPVAKLVPFRTIFLCMLALCYVIL
ncbi:MAG: hypothetical protein DCF19_17210 [Pseudanabaena frigida]|uniref:Antitoxin n=1 Tax=Pseudanabaena frigida TaxID=945775 RepID=A0A2W4W3Y0_9CYAN|nr:MAG: hypothetical protein DCF19_17210 [Pseudanabaena frigida]